jgi:predicted ATPase/class 3 adenylate cyclase
MSDLPVRIFVSYSHSDAEYLGETSLLGFLHGLEREGAEFWIDERIAAGDKWDDEIRSRISQSDIALVLVSQRFLDSAYCTNVEIAGFLDRSRGSGLIIVPVILSPCEWERHSWLSSTQYLPSSGETIEEHYLDPGTRKRLFLTIRSNLRERIEKLRQARQARPEPAPPAKRPIVGERRQVTALECEITALGGANALDPEEVVEILPEYRSRATEVVKRLDGHIAQLQGRRVLAYFGCPRVHEDDARRAVIAAREIVALAKNFDAGAGGQSSLALKLAIHTGSMVIWAAPDDAVPMLVGDVPDVVAAVLNLTPPNRVHVTATTHELIGKEYACAATGKVELKDLGRSLQVFALEGDGATFTPSALVRKTLVARDHELEILRQRWQLAREGDGQVVYVRGEAGIGKSRLVQELRAEVTSEPTMLWLECRCSPYHQNTELYPLIDLLQRALAFAGREQQTGAAERLEDIVSRVDMPVETVVPLLSALLGLPLAPGYQAVNLSPEGRRKKTLAAVLDLILGLAARQPVLMLVEDLHWIDASTLGFLDLLIQMQATAPLLTLLTFRPEFEPPWRQLSYLSGLSLRRLGSRETGALISVLTDGNSLPPDLLKEIIEKADGIPLFVEELTKMVTESELVEAAKGRYQLVAAGEKLAVPATLEGSLIARLDRLDTAKEIAQVASVIGREFFRDLLSQVASVAEEALTKDLERLLQSEIILRRGLPSNCAYFFKHALIQQAAYETILSRDARQLHGKIAQALESKFPDLAERQPEVVAFHFMRAGLTEKAIDNWQRAAERSIKNSANPEAIAHLTKCLELLAELPQSRERDRREMRLRTALALPLIATKGYSAVEVDEALIRARQLCMEIGDDAELFRVVRLHWPFQSMRADHRKAAEAAQQMIAMAESDAARLEANRTMGATLFYLGRFREAQQYFERAIVFYNRKRDHSNVLVYGQDPGVSCLANETPNLWFMGYPDQARARGAEALVLARELSHPYSLCFALLFCSWQYVFRRDLDTLHENVEEMISVARHQSFALWETIGMILEGWMNAQRGETAVGLATMMEGMARWGRLGARVFVPTFLALVAEIHAGEGDVEAGLAAVEEGLAVCETTAEVLSQPELYRLKGELLSIRAPGSSAAEEWLIRARQSAAAQASKSLELRATIGLSRFWSATGKGKAAQDVLEETRGWFSEGDDTYDLRQADELRAELRLMRT